MSFRVLGTGSYAPPRVVTNDELSTFLDTSDEWIYTRVGVRRRHVCTTETTVDLAAEAGRRALENAGLTPGDLDLILCATVSGDDISPTLSCMVQNRLGATCPCMDINAACPAFIFLLDTAAGFFARKRAKRILVVGAERMSRVVDWTDRSTCVIFGDGAGAMVLGEGENYLASKLFARGGDDVIKMPMSAGISPFYTRETLKPYVHMQGQATFKFAVNAMCTDVLDVLREAGVSQQEVDCVIPHQANIRIIDAAKRKLEIPPERFHSNIEEYGNTSAGSIPLLADELNRSGALREGDLVVLTAFGGGLSSAACLLRW